MKTKIPDAMLAAEVSRRGLVKTTAIGGLAVASSAFTLPFTRIANAAEALNPTQASEKVIWSACTVNCGSRCPLRMHVVDGEIKYVETDNTGDDNYDGLHVARLPCHLPVLQMLQKPLIQHRPVRKSSGVRVR